MTRTHKTRNALLGLGLGAFGLGCSLMAAPLAAAQASPDAAPPPAYGQNAPILNPDNPPVSGLDLPSLDLRTASRSFVSPSVQVSESGDTNALNQLSGQSGPEGVTRVLGALDLQQFWSKSDLFLEYLGGGAFYSSPYEVRQLQAAGLEGVTRWRTGQLTLRDAFSYLPDGSFSVGVFGGVPGFGLATGGGTNGLGSTLPGANNLNNGELGSVGSLPRLSNTVVLDAVQAISPKSAITLAGAFNNAHFYDPTSFLINSDQITGEAGYSHLLKRHDQIGLVYAYQLFQFPQYTGGEVYNQIVNLRWSHTISGRLSLIVGVGPQYTDLKSGGSYAHWSESARVLLRYKMGHASITGSYEKYISAGSGFFAGADTQLARGTYLRPLARTWTVYADLVYSHNSSLQNLVGFGASPASSYNDGSASLILRKHMGRTYEFFAGYRFTELAFNTPPDPTLGLGGNGREAQRHIGTIGVEWHPKPTRIE